jgi:predicted carbohydrate-binding protein with CBM5 and CBM33 domain
MVNTTRYPTRLKNVSNSTPNASANEACPQTLWVKSSLSFANGDCVEVASFADGRIGVRDSKDTEGPVLRFTSAEWNAFIGGVRNGEFDNLFSI